MLWKDALILFLICAAPDDSFAFRLKRHHNNLNYTNATSNSTSFGVLEGIFVGLAVVGLAAKTVHHFQVEDAKCGEIIDRYVSGRQWQSTGMGRFAGGLFGHVGGVLKDLAFGVEDAENLPQVDCENMINAFEVQIIAFAYVEGCKKHGRTDSDHQDPNIINDFFFEGVRDAMNNGNSVIEDYKDEVMADITEEKFALELGEKVERVMRDAIVIVKDMLKDKRTGAMIVDKVRQNLEAFKAKFNQAGELVQRECPDDEFCANEWYKIAGDKHGFICAPRLVHNTGKTTQNVIPLFSYLVVGWGIKLLLIKWAMVQHASEAIVHGLWGFGLPDVTLGLNRFISRGLGWTKTKNACNLRTCSWDDDEESCVMNGGEDEELNGEELPALGLRCIKKDPTGLIVGLGLANGTPTCQVEACPHMADENYYKNNPSPDEERWNCKDPKPKVEQTQKAIMEWMSLKAQAERHAQDFQRLWRPVLAASAAQHPTSLWLQRGKYRSAVSTPGQTSVAVPRVIILPPIYVSPNGTSMSRAPQTMSARGTSVSRTPQIVAAGRPAVGVSHPVAGVHVQMQSTAPTHVSHMANGIGVTRPTVVTRRMS